MLRSYGRLLTSFSRQSVRPYAAKGLKATTSEIPGSNVIETQTADEATEDAVPALYVGIAERQAALDESLQAGFKKRRTRRVRIDGVLVERSAATKLATAATVTASAEAKRRPTKASNAIPPRLLPSPEQQHHDLPSYIAHAERSKVNTDSWTYRGTHFEYTVAEALKPFAFTLHRTAGANDLGIDFVGDWALPHGNSGIERKVIVQCKLSKPMPAMVRELEGAYTGAPAGWRGDDVLALLASLHPSTKGVRAAIQRSRWPLGFLQVTESGEVKQFLWNAVAADKGLEGLGVAVKHASKRGGVVGADEKDVEASSTASSIGLTWLGDLWRPTGGVVEEAPGTMSTL